jgi:hypothetical protein
MLRSTIFQLYHGGKERERERERKLKILKSKLTLPVLCKI